MANELDMTRGKPLGLLVRFSLPMLLGDLFQLLYTLVDGAVVGRLLGVEAFAAVGAAGFLHWLFLSTAMSMAHGFGTLFAQRYGAKDYPGFRRALAGAGLLAVGFGFLFSLGGALLCGKALAWLQTPGDILRDAAAYLRFLLWGIVVSFLYNVLGAALRAQGDSRTPLQAMVLSTLLNIILDILLVTVLPLGVGGIAAATVLAQAAACAYCVPRLYARKELRLTGRDFREAGPSCRILLRLGAPLGLRDCVIALGGLVTQYVVNGYGTAFVAGVAAAKRLGNLIWAVGGAFEAAVAVFAAQNIGAGLPDRVKRGVAVSSRVLLAASGLFMALTLLFGRGLASLFIAGDVEQAARVLDIAWRQLSVMALGLPALHLLFLYRAALQGLGNSVMPMVSGFFELGMRIACVLILPLFLAERGVYLADTVGWVAAAPQLFIAYGAVYRKKRRALAGAVDR